MPCELESLFEPDPYLRTYWELTDRELHDEGGARNYLLRVADRKQAEADRIRTRVGSPAYRTKVRKLALVGMIREAVERNGWVVEYPTIDRCYVQIRLVRPT